MMRKQNIVIEPTEFGNSKHFLDNSILSLIVDSIVTYLEAIEICLLVRHREQ